MYECIVLCCLFDCRFGKITDGVLMAKLLSLIVIAQTVLSMLGPIPENDSILEHNILCTKMKLIVLTPNIDISNTNSPIVLPHRFTK